MKVNSLDLFNFRNYNHFFIEFDHDINVLIGDNAQGKTNLIEAIYLLSVGRSFKTHINKQMINFDQDFARVTGNVTSNQKLKKLQVIVGENFKKAKIDGKDIFKISDYVGNLNVIVFTPDDLDLVKGSPAKRRKFVNLELSKISPIYIFNLGRYHNLLKERNQYLKILANKSHRYDEYIEVLDEQLSKIQVELINKRIDFINKLSLKVRDMYLKISKNDEVIELKYECFCKSDISETNIMNIYQKSFKRDLKYYQSHYGIHKDDVKILIDGKDASNFASQGQQRTIVLSLKIALIELIKDEIGEYPVLLLDDVLSELDDHRKTMLLNLLNNKIQTFITTTSIDGISHEIISNAKKIYIRDGKEDEQWMKN